MKIDIRNEPTDCLESYSSIPISFEVYEFFDFTHKIQPGIDLPDVKPVSTAYIKNYDAIDLEHPTQWHLQFDLAHWGIFGAWVEDQRVGGIAIAGKMLGLDILSGREDIAILWDLRIAQNVRGQGIGSALFRSAEHWALAQ